jgi:hypothetical protein
VHGLISVAAGSDWTYGASIFTFLFPYLLFIGVASALYVLYTKPHLVPGHRYQVQMRSVADTPAPGTPGAGTPGAGTPEAGTSGAGSQAAAQPQAPGASGVEG